MESFSLDLGLKNTHVAVTGGAGMIGSAVVSAFITAGANVSILDVNQSALEHLSEAIESKPWVRAPQYRTQHVDISQENSVKKAFEEAEHHFGPIQTCVALASLDLSVLPKHDSIVDMDFAQWQRTFSVNVHGTFLTAKEWLSRLRDLRKYQAHNETLMSMKNVNLIIVGSEAGLFGVTGSPDYSAGKSAVQGGLLQSLKTDAPRIWPGARYAKPSLISTVR